MLSLLDRTSSHDDAPDEERDIMANEYLASFKVRRKKLTFNSRLQILSNSSLGKCRRMSKEKEQDDGISYAAFL